MKFKTTEKRHLRRKFKRHIHYGLYGYHDDYKYHDDDGHELTVVAIIVAVLFLGALGCTLV